jgi:hypothetical protein
VTIDDYFAALERGLRHNAPHHREIATHPHHKHIGPEDRVAPADQPSLNQVLAEIESWPER